ncbi:MAG: CPBP family intramembrane glutamic endopeptidase [Verrucomicrobiales bacterium]
MNPNEEPLRPAETGDERGIHGDASVLVDPLPLLKRWGFWETFGFGFAIAFVVIMVQSIATVPFLLVGYFKDPEVFQESLKEIQFDGMMIGVSSLVSIPAVIGACWLLASFRKSRGITPKQYLGLNLMGWKSWVLWPIVTLIFMNVVGWILIECGAPKDNPWMKEMSEKVTHFGWLAFAVVIGAPLIEEFVFRGFLFAGFRESLNRFDHRLSLIVTILLTNTVWTLIHGQYDIYGLVAVFSLGLLLSASCVISKSLWAPIWIHFINNAFACFEMWKMANGAE